MQELTDEQPTQFVRVLGEDLVLFKDKSGNVGLIQDHCAHRGASLLYGRVEERGISCAYHGWLYDTAGNCLETPAEPRQSMFHLTVKMQAYPVQKFVGMYWAYLGPLPAPEIPHYDVGSARTAADDRLRSSRSSTATGCRRWRTPSTRPTCRSCTRNRSRPRSAARPSTTRGFTDDVDELRLLRVRLSAS